MNMYENLIHTSYTYPFDICIISQYYVITYKIVLLKNITITHFLVNNVIMRKMVNKHTNRKEKITYLNLQQKNIEWIFNYSFS